MRVPGTHISSLLEISVIRVCRVEAVGYLVAVEEVPDSETSKYGVISPVKTQGNRIEMSGMVENSSKQADITPNRLTNSV